MEKKIVSLGSLLLFDLQHFNQKDAPYSLSGLGAEAGYAIQLELKLGQTFGTLLACHSESGEVFSLSVENNEAGSRLVFTFFSQGEKDPFLLVAPIERSESCAMLDVIIWVSNVRAALIINDKLVDEEWPLGNVSYTGEVKLEISTVVDDMVVCGYRNLEIINTLLADTISSESSGLQYWRPKGHNYRCWRLHAILA